MSKEVSVLEATGELTNASAARGPTPTLVVRRPDDGSRPEIPAMTLRSHSRGGRSSACAQEPSSQAGNCTTGNENLGVQPTRQEKSRPEPEIPPSHGRGSDPPPSGNNPPDDPRKMLTDNRWEVPIGLPEVIAGPTPSERSEVFNILS